MLISASRRTDIPAFYSEWLVNRLRAGFCEVRNPMNASQIRRVSLLRKDVDGIVLWTKNAAPLLPKMSAIDAFPFYFQHTITAYDAVIERGLASKKSVVIPAFVELARRYGNERLVWRYDPILFTERYTHEYHIRAFSRLCELLEGRTRRCVVSFVLPYRSIANKMRNAGIVVPSDEQRAVLITELVKIAAAHGIELCACCESAEIYALGITPASCVDAELMGRIAGRTFAVKRDKNQRNGCNCAVSVDIGAYNSCPNGCVYCYANHGDKRVADFAARRDAEDAGL